MLNANDLRKMTHQYHMDEIEKNMILSIQNGKTYLNYSVPDEYVDDIVDELKEHDYEIQVGKGSGNVGYKIIRVIW